MQQVIKGDKNKAIKHYFLLCIPCFCLIALLFYVVQISNDIACESLFGVNLFLVSILALAYVMPCLFFLFSVWCSLIGWKVIKKGYFPPLDMVLFCDSVAKKGKLQQIRGWVLLLSPILALVGLVIGHFAFEELNQVFSQSPLEATCDI
jgi:hypothetical protein